MTLIFILASLLRPLCDFARILIDPGVNFTGTLNFFGGLTEIYFNHLVDLVEAWKRGVEIYSLEEDLSRPEIYEQFRGRIGKRTTDPRFCAAFVNDLEEMLKQCETRRYLDLNDERIMIGDSHATAFADGNQSIKKENGKLLYSILRDGLTEYLKVRITRATKEVTLCFGSIDLRFHVCRLKTDPGKLAYKYLEAVRQAEEDLDIKIKICAPVPVEHEERKIPKTGQYRGKNFFGTREERHQATMEFFLTLMNNVDPFDLINPPISWYYLSGEAFAKKYMERGGSVHISPEKYRSNNWGVDWANSKSQHPR